MELSRPFEPLTAAAVVAGTAGIRIALEHAQENEACKRGQAEHQGGLSAREVGCGTHQFVDRLSAHVLGELLHPLRRAPHEMRELRRAAVKTVGGRVDGVGDVTHQLAPDATCCVKKPFALSLASAASDEAACLAWLPACCATSASFETASPALARTPCSDPDRLDRADSDAEVFVPEGCGFFGFLQSGDQPPAQPKCSSAERVSRRPRSDACALFGRSIATPMPRLDVPLFASSCHPVIGDDLRYEVAPLVGRSIKNQVIRKLFSPQPVPHRFSAVDD